ncbi:hypothetical protein MMC26_005090 [Xylographa opegraphella]|nr:hypothetical protein [Xylographa opegraphella]
MEVSDDNHAMAIENLTYAIMSNSTNSTTLAPDTYLTFPLYSGFIIAHVILMTAAWIFILPISVMLSIGRARLASATQLVFISINAVGILLGTIYNNKTPEFYENNVHNKLGWLVTWIVSIQAIIGLTRKYGRAVMAPKPSYEITMAQYRNVQDLGGAQPYRYSQDSGHGTEPSTPRESSLASPQASDEDREYTPMFSRDNDLEHVMGEKRDIWTKSIIRRIFSKRFLATTQHQVVTCIYVLHDIVDRLILILGFVALLSGLVIYGGIFKADGIFSGLAHFIKGGIFFWYGLLTLGRVMGSFADIGWSWNIKPPASAVGARKAAAPTAEFVESFLIFLYGATNVWLEHLGESGKAWSAGDLEHVSISVMFFGGGLCGMLIESRAIRDLLNSALPFASSSMSSSAQWHPPRTYGFSTNPLPAIIILLLGMLMSGHHQSLMVSTKLHSMWGNLFFAAALARGATYMLMYLSPPTSHLPSRPPSEIVVAFCLISGGTLFMFSNTDVVNVLAARDLNAMFVFTLAMSLTALLMAWEVVVLAVKAWAVEREARGVVGGWWLV